jgi:uncharacterized membrane-anchored protein YitT (DUF2179 family)
VKKALKTLIVDTLDVKQLTRRETIKSTILIAAGILSATAGLTSFLLPQQFLDGGVTGISLLLSHFTGLSFSIFLIVLNIPFIILGFKQIGIKFARRASFAVAGLAITVQYVDFPTATYDPILVAIFGGFFVGAGIGLAMRGGAVIDGTEILAVHISRNSSLSIGDFITLFNVVLFIIATVSIDLETAMYSMITYIVASKTVDFIISGIEEYIGVTIISDKYEELEEAITNGLGMAVTVYRGEGGIGKTGKHNYERNILFSVVTRLEVQKLCFEIEKIDPHAFVIQHTINDTRGGMIKKRPLH